MPQYDHLPLVRLPENLTRRKTGRPPPSPKRENSHGTTIRTETNEAVRTQRQSRPAQFVDPSLVLKVGMSGLPMEDDWEGVGLRMLSSDNNNTLILFSSTEELTDFREKLDAYEGPIPPNQKGRRFAGFVDRIETIAALVPRDRLGIRLLERGFTDVEDFQNDEVYLIDIELWDFAGAPARRRKADEIRSFIEERNGEVLDIYVGPSLTILRTEAPGRTIRPLLSVAEVESVDLPPEPDLETPSIIDMDLGELPPIEPAPEDAPIVAILDSGINQHPLLDDVLLASEAFPTELGTADVWGHGTKVGGAVVYGDIRNQIDNGQFQKSVRLISAKIITDDGQFYSRRSLPNQMREIFQNLNERYGCRIFVLSLGDRKASFERGRVGPWAMTLDELAKELDVLIFVSAGNRSPRGGNNVEQAVTQYPFYLLEDANRLFEPSGAANVVTVGAVSHASGLGAGHQNDAHVRAITTAPYQPSPFTRTGPGAGKVTKPDFVDLGGTMVFDAVTRSLRTAPDIPEAGIVTLNPNYLAQLFTSTKGTSLSTPILARKAAFLMQKFPNASANLIRALLAGAAQIPDDTAFQLDKLRNIDAPAIVGNGIVDQTKAAYSDDHRVIYFSDDQLDIDKFAIYSIPIPAEFQSGGKRTIRISLAYDPPVRRTRAEYIGTKMDFRLIRGGSVELVSEHFRSHTGEEETYPPMPNSYDCDLLPNKTQRAGNTLQTAQVSFTRDTDPYGNEYYLVVRCMEGWATDEVSQRFAVTVELEHQAGVQLYARLRERVRMSGL